MNELVWLFPILFILHDMEEIIGLGIWLNNNREMLKKRFPFILKMYPNFSTEGVAFGISEELVLSVAFSAVARFTDNKYAYLIWLGAFIAYAFHLVIHIGQSIIVKKYIPAVATSIALLPISVYVIYQSILKLNYSAFEVVIFSLIGLAVIALNLKFVHYIANRFTLWMRKDRG